MSRFTIKRDFFRIFAAEIIISKYEALRAICLSFLPHHMTAFDDAIAHSLERTAVVKITLTAPPTGKRKQYDKQGEEMKGRGLFRQQITVLP